MIARDGICTSLWQHMPSYQSLQATSSRSEYEVAIIGGGITGITTAILLQKAGKKCILLEANNIGFGTTGGTTAHLNTLLDTPYNTIIKKFGHQHAEQVRTAVEEALKLIKSHVEEYTIDCGFEETSAYLFSQDEKQQQELKEIAEACLAVKLDIAEAGEIPVPIPFISAMEIKAQAKFHPLRYVYALAHEFEKLGGVILQNNQVTHTTHEREFINVHTQAGLFQAKSVVYATHTPPGINLMHLRCSPLRSYVMAVTLKSIDEYPRGLAYDMYDPYHYYRAQEIDGVSYLIVGGEDHKTGHDENTESKFLALESHIRKYFNVNEITARWSSQYFESVDGLPYIGHLPGGGNNVYVATGFGGNGMTYGTLSAIILKNIILNIPHDSNGLFTPSRIKPIAGFTGFMDHNIDVVKEMVEKFLTREKLHELATLAPGEGKVVKYENQFIGLSKDMQGNVHAVNPVCTHMKCNVSWNLSEQSWDCPCHGARYSPDGKVLTGPASKNLKSIALQQESTAEVKNKQS